jgi:hypothetical protein
MVGYAQTVIYSRLGTYIANQYDELHDIPVIARSVEINIRERLEQRQTMQKIENIKRKKELCI